MAPSIAAFLEGDLMATWLENAFDRVIGLVAPRTALKHASTRNALQMLRRSYEGAKTGRFTDGWITAGTDADSEISLATVKLRDRARDLVRNNPYAAKTVMTHASSLIGSGISPQIKARTKKQDDLVSDLWNSFVDECDADGRTNFYGLQTLSSRSMVESGECLIQLLPRPTSLGLKVPLQLRVLEIDHLDTSVNKELPGGGYIQQGIEFNAMGIREAYYLFDRHPGSGLRLTSVPKSNRIPATEILHLFERLRPGQTRGVSWFAPALMRIRDMDDYDLAELTRKRLEACYVAFITGGDPGEYTGSEMATSLLAKNKPIKNMEPGMVEYLEPGSDVKFGQPSNVTGYAEYASLHHHAMAAGMGLTYELLTGDLSKVNYSSIRAGMLEFRRRTDALQKQVFIPQVCQPIWRRFLLTAQAAGLVGTFPIRLQWTPPRFEAVDPIKDLTAEILAVRAGLMSPQTAIARQGFDPDNVAADFAAMYEIWDNLKIITDMDARKTTKTGQQKLMETANAATAV